MSSSKFIGSDAHKELFCSSLIGSHRAYQPADLPWPELDDMSLARLRAIPIWTMALEIEINAGQMLSGYAQTEPDPLVRQALALQGYEEDRHGRILAHMVQKYGLHASPQELPAPPTRAAFVDFGYNECVDSFAGFGIFRLARESQILPDTLTSVFTRVLVEEARHIVFFVNWIAWERTRRGLRGPIVQALPTLLQYANAILRRVKNGMAMESGQPNESKDNTQTIDLFSDVMGNLTPAKFVRACLEENERYMRDFDPRLLRPRVIPTLASIALAIIEAIEGIRALLRPAQRGA